MESRALSDSEFPEFASNVVLFLHNTSQVEDEPYPTLLRDKGFGGFPALCFMDADGNVLAKPAGREVPVFTETLAKAKRVVELRAKGDKATAEEQKELLMAELRNGLLKREDIQPRADKLTLSAEEKAYVSGKIVDLEVQELMAANRRTPPAEMMPKLAAMLEAGKTPSDENTQFWSTMLRYASTEKNADLAQRAHDVLMKNKNANERMKEQWQQALEEAKAK